MNQNLLISALAANYQNWPYYQVVLKIEDIVQNFGTKEKPNYRIKTADEVEVIYSQKGLNHLLQRALDPKRLEPIRQFINEQPDAYVNNITVAIYGGAPKWYPIEMKRSSFKEEVTDEEYHEIIDKYGLIKLSGDETLFVLDGQHRLKALRLAFEKDPSIGGNQIAFTLITHVDDEAGKAKTRRLFSIINRHAKPVSLGENILLDEDDLSAILVRKFIEEYPLFKDKEIIALNKTADLKMPRDASKFSTVIALWAVNEMLIDVKEVYPKYKGAKSNLVRIRPSDEVGEKYRKLVFEFWDTFFECFPKTKLFVETSDTGIRGSAGPFSLRPIGQQLFADYYVKVKSIALEDQLSYITKVPDEISDSFWHHVLFDPTTKNIMQKRAYARDYLFYHLHVPLSQKAQSKLLSNYRKYCRDEKATLPPKLVLS